MIRPRVLLLALFVASLATPLDAIGGATPGVAGANVTAPSPAVVNVATSGGPSGLTTPMPATSLRGVARQGIWAYADPSHGPRYLAIPEGAGWLVDVCGPAACLTRVSTDAGPVKSLQRAGRLGDLSAVDFEAVCAMTPAQRVAIGLCPGSLTIQRRPSIRPPETSTVPTLWDWLRVVA